MMRSEQIRVGHNPGTGVFGRGQKGVLDSATQTRQEEGRVKTEAEMSVI